MFEFDFVKFFSLLLCMLLSGLSTLLKDFFEIQVELFNQI